MNAQILPSRPPHVHRFPHEQMRPVHHNCGLWIFRWGSVTTSCPDPGCHSDPLWRYFEFYAISHLLDGGGIFRRPDGRVEPIAPGQCVMVQPGYIHYYGPVNEPFYTEDTINFIGPLADMLFRSGVFAPGVFDCGLTRKLGTIIELAGDPSDNGQLNAAFALQKFLYDLYNRRFTAASDQRFRRIDALLEELKNNPAKWWTLNDMAEYCRLGDDQFRRLFHSRVGLNPKLYLDNLRMNHAARLLAESVVPILDIATTCGYSDPFHFSRRFKAIMGISPQKYREEAVR